MARIAATDIQAGIPVGWIADRDVIDGPVRIPDGITEIFRALLREIRRDATDVLGVGLSLLASVDQRNGRVAGSSIMLGWDGLDIHGWFASSSVAPVMADNDVNLMALVPCRGRSLIAEQL